MPLASGTCLGPYEIVSQLGVGGMGEVYRARDSRLNRDVAIKILLQDVSDTPARRTRFEREARTISRLNHPHICAIYDVGEQDGVAYLVMEYVEGKSLEQWLLRGPLPPATALEWAVQTAAALDAAHRSGIIHRDLKPANVMVTDQGIKLLDFGIAKLLDEPGDETARALGATSSLTDEHRVIGTVHYMAPEQLEERPVDARTDVFALGALLYEMLTGRKAFDGTSAASVTAAVLTTAPPPVSSAAATAGSDVPRELDHVVQRALARDPDERWQTARDVMHELQWILDDGAHVTAGAMPTIRPVGRVALLAVGAVAVLVGLVVHSTPRLATPHTGTPIHLSFFRPGGVELTNTGRSVLTISPDGTQIVFNANNQLYIRRLDATESVPIAGTQGTGLQTPFFSPDGRWVAFFSVETHELKKIPVNGGVAVTIFRSPAGSRPGNFGATWTTDDQILFATLEGVFRVSAHGGMPQKIVSSRAGETVFAPQMLPDGDHLLLTVTTATGAGRWDKAQIIAQSLSSGARTVLVEGGADARYLDTGHIVYAVGTTLFAVAADARSLRILGAPVPIVRDVRRANSPDANTGDVSVAISKTGTLAYIPATPDSSINASVDMRGRVTPLPPDAGLREVRVSPDGSRMLVWLLTKGNALWIYSVTGRAAPRQLTTDGSYSNALWTPDGTRVAFRSELKSGAGIFWQRADGAAPAEMLLDVDGRPVGWSRDGETLFYISVDSNQLWSWRRGGQPRSLLSIGSPYASLSPDRRWVAFHSYENGRSVPYVQSLSNPGSRFRISKDAGHAPLWSPDGRKLFYVAGETNSLTAVDVQTTPIVAFGDPVVLVPEILHGLSLKDRIFDITPDGEQLIVQVPDRENVRSREVDVVLNWFEELKRRLPPR